MRWLVAFLVMTLSWLSVVGGARAQSAVVSAALSDDVVEVGETFNLTLSATVQDADMPSKPRFTPPDGFTTGEPSVSKSTFDIRLPGRAVRKNNFSARWKIRASQVGTFTLPSPTMEVEGQIVSASDVLTVRVVEAGSKPKTGGPRQPFGFGSFFGPGMTLRLDDDFFADMELDDLDPRGRDFRLSSEPQEYLFVKAIPDRTSVYVGEQVTLSFYIYYRVRFRLVDRRDPPLADFMRVEVGGDEHVQTRVGRWHYNVRLLDRLALFPLRAGELETGEMTISVESPRLGRDRVSRISDSVTINVKEPPKEGRPVGYTLGDTGRFKLEATVSPREITSGETVAVQARLTGLGALPTKLKLPERTGLEWLTPERTEDVSLHRGRVGGWRNFGYAVRISDVGEIDLGSIELPYWDPDRRRYETASVELGTVMVKPGEGTAPDDSDEEGGAFGKLAPARKQLSAWQPEVDEGVAPQTFAALVATPPLGVALAGLMLQLGRRARRRREEAKNAPTTLARQALRDLERAEGDGADIAALAERAIHQAIEAACGLKSRGVLLADLAGELKARDIDAADAERICALLDTCATLRFAPSSDDNSELRDNARSVVKSLLRS